MNRTPDRRTILMATGVAALAAGWPLAAQSKDIAGAVSFEGGTAIPKGQIELYLADPAVEDNAQRRVAEIVIESDGGSKEIAFSLPALESPTASPTLQIIARLERADGWLVARGSAQVEAGSPIHITLNAVMY